MKIICIGLPKTGTHSVLTALRVLGYKTHHYPFVKDVLKILETKDAIAECAAIIMWKELGEIYDCKFILTTRDVEPWLKSCKNWMTKVNVNPNLIALESRDETLGTRYYNKEKLIRKYKEHHKEVKDYFKDKPGNLLIMNISKGDGYEVLCKFLNKPVIKKPFPKKNVKKYGR